MELKLAGMLLLRPNTHAKQITMGIEAVDYQPFYGGKGRAGYSGFARDLFKEFAKEKGHKISFITMPVNKLFDSFAEGAFDLKFPDNKMWKADKRKGLRVSYSDVVIRIDVGVISLKENSDNAPKVVGVVEGLIPWSLYFY